MNKVRKIHFEVTERKLLLRIFDVAFVLIFLHYVGNFFNLEYLKDSTSNFYSVSIIAVYINVLGTVFEMYSLHIARNQSKIIKSTILTALGVTLLYLFTPILSAVLPSHRFQILTFFLVIVFSLIFWRTLYINLLASSRFMQNVVLVCDRNQLEEIIPQLERADPHYKIIAYVNTDLVEDKDGTFSLVDCLSIEELDAFVEKNIIFEIVVSSLKAEEISVVLYQKLLQLLQSGTMIREFAQVFEEKVQRIPIHYMRRDFYKFFPFNRSNYNQLYLFEFNIIGIIISIVGLLLGLLFIPIVLIGNAFGNPGKLFYSQERVGKNGKVFSILKFRTMVDNAEQNGAVFSTSNDQRVTPFGRFLRKTRIDEFPQFINILKGDMSVIGPRPERPCFVNQIAEIMPFYETRHVIKPGLTGWAQVKYSYGECIDDSLIKLQYDLYYIKHRGLFIDLNIFIKTISTVLFYRGH